MDRRFLISCLVLAGVICVVLSCISIGVAGFFLWDSGELGGSANQMEPETPPNSDPILSDGTLTPAVQAQMELIQRQVIQGRGLDPNGEFSRNLFTSDQLRQRVLDDFLQDYSPEEAQKDAITLAAFGLLDPGYDLYNLYIALLNEQIAGFYDNETKEMVIVQGKGFGGSERLTYAHEYVHALQDQNYDIRDGLNYSSEACEDTSERCAAIQALLEGDASLSELNWFKEHASSQDQSDIFDFYDEFKSPILDSSPAFLSEDFIFPYEEGLAFVEYLHDRGGWEAVDQAYANLPVSTEQILHPEKYPADTPLPVNLPEVEALLGDGWEEYDRGVMGEWYTFLILAYGEEAGARQKEKDAARAAEGWGGDAYMVYYHPEDQTTVMVLTTVWDSASEAKEFFNAFRDYAKDRFGRPRENRSGSLAWEGAEEQHTLHIAEAQTIWILAPDADLADTIWNTMYTTP